MVRKLPAFAAFSLIIAFEQSLLPQILPEGEKHHSKIMKKAYSTPKLTNHGDISAITNITGGGTRQDVLFGPPNGSTVISTSQGSADNACVIKPGTKVCL